MSEIKTYGQKLVGANPADDENVKNTRLVFAAIIDLLNELRKISASDEQKRAASIAITETQTAQMWAVKALTYKD